MLLAIALCKMVNLILTILLDWLGEILSINRKSHEIPYMMTLWLFGTLQSYGFAKL